jgi:hypothetical protein
MNSTVSMWLGIAFLVLAFVAVILQAWLWNPKYWDEQKKRTFAPPFWIAVHRVVGYLYAGIYVVMMWEMLPRLWQYQVELPARTVIHAVAALVIGVILITKILILRFFRYFEEAMPALGFALLVCTVVLCSLSLPYVIQAHGAGLDLGEADITRVKEVLAHLELPEEFSPEVLTKEQSFENGRDVLVHKCTPCHDIRTILSRPRSGESWLTLNQRMAEKPQIADPITQADVYFVTSYLIAVTPGIQESTRQLREARLAQAQAADALEVEDGEEAELAEGEAEMEPAEGETPAEALPEESAEGEAAVEGEAPAEGETPADGEAPAEGETAMESETPTEGETAMEAEETAMAEGETEPLSPREEARRRRQERRERARAAQRRLAAQVSALSREEVRDVTRRVCTGCHGWDEMREHGGDTMAGWSRVIRRMIVNEGAEISDLEARIALRYLAGAFPARD